MLDASEVQGRVWEPGDYRDLISWMADSLNSDALPMTTERAVYMAHMLFESGAFTDLGPDDKWELCWQVASSAREAWFVSWDGGRLVRLSRIQNNGNPLAVFDTLPVEQGSHYCSSLGHVLAAVSVLRVRAEGMVA